MGDQKNGNTPRQQRRGVQRSSVPILGVLKCPAMTRFHALIPCAGTGSRAATARDCSRLSLRSARSTSATRIDASDPAQVAECIRANGITHVLTATEQLSMQPTLTSLARRLNADEFFQVSRTAIIRLDAIKEARPFTDGTGEILLANHQTMTVARRRWRLLLDKLEA